MNPRSVRRCPHCDGVIPPNRTGRGRPKKWCSDDCRRAAHAVKRAPLVRRPAPPVDLDAPPAPPTVLVEMVPRDLTPDELIARVQNDVHAMYALVDVLIDRAKAKTLDYGVELACAELARQLLPGEMRHEANSFCEITTAQIVARAQRDPAAMLMLVGALIWGAKRRMLDQDEHHLCLQLARVMLPQPRAGASLAATEADWESWSQPGRQHTAQLVERLAASMDPEPVSS